jgi:hypothetical protein
MRDRLLRVRQMLGGSGGSANVAALTEKLLAIQ